MMYESTVDILGMETAIIYLQVQCNVELSFLRQIYYTVYLY